jgi:uncharacterized LabA/DUF88 family protein
MTVKRLKSIPETFPAELEAGAPPVVVAAPAGLDRADLARVVEELRGVLRQPRESDLSLLSALHGVAATMREQNARLSAPVPPPQHPQGTLLRLGVFVDVANVANREGTTGYRIEYGRLLDYLARNRRLVHARAYCPIISDYIGRIQYQRTVAPIWNKGYKIITKPIKTYPDGTRKADLDLTLAIDAIRRAETIDVMALISGDGDFVPLVEYMQERGIRVECYCFGESMSEELRLAVDHFEDFHSLTQLHLRLGEYVAAGEESGPALVPAAMAPHVEPVSE